MPPLRIGRGAAMLALLLAAGAVRAAGPDVPPAEVREPLFAFVLEMTARDSLGTWTAADLLSFAAGRGQASAFPLTEHLESLTREAVPVRERPHLQGVFSRRRWVLRLRPALFELPLPYRFLGYRPGKLSCLAPLHLEEWRLGDRRLQLSGSAGEHAFDLQDLTIYRISGGWLILDVHAWLDRLLGKALEDVALEGFVIGRLDGELVAVGNGAGRGGRRIYGELDLRSGELRSGGRPQALALSRHGRTWTRPPDHDHRAVWRDHRRRR